MSTAIERYREIMRRYRAGEFGERHLYLHQILTLAGAPDILHEMAFDKLSELILETDNMYSKRLIGASNITNYVIRECGDGWEYCDGECECCPKAQLTASTSVDDTQLGIKE